MTFMIEVRPMGPLEATSGAARSGRVVDAGDVFDPRYERLLGLIVRSLAAHAELTLAEQEWIRG